MTNVHAGRRGSEPRHDPYHWRAALAFGAGIVVVVLLLAVYQRDAHVLGALAGAPVGTVVYALTYRWLHAVRGRSAPPTS